MRIITLLGINFLTCQAVQDSIFTFTKSINIAIVGDDSLSSVPLFEAFQKNGDYEEIQIHNFAHDNKTVIKQGKEIEQFSFIETLNYRELIALKPEIIILMFGTRDSQKETWNHGHFYNDLSELAQTLRSIEIGHRHKFYKPDLYLGIPPPFYANQNEGVDKDQRQIIEQSIPNIVKDVAKELDLKDDHIINFFEAMGGKDLRKPDYFCESKDKCEVSPTEEGNEFMAQLIKGSLVKSVNFKDTVFNNNIFIGRYHTDVWMKIIICLNVITYCVYQMIPTDKFASLVNNHFSQVLYNEIQYFFGAIEVFEIYQCQEKSFQIQHQNFENQFSAEHIRWQKNHYKLQRDTYLAIAALMSQVLVITIVKMHTRKTNSNLTEEQMRIQKSNSVNGKGREMEMEGFSLIDSANHVQF